MLRKTEIQIPVPRSEGSRYADASLGGVGKSKERSRSFDGLRPVAIGCKACLLFEQLDEIVHILETTFRGYLLYRF